MHTSKFRISSVEIFYVVSMCACSVSLFGWVGIPVALLLVLIWWQLYSGIARELGAVAKAESSNLPHRPMLRNWPGDTSQVRINSQPWRFQFLAILLMAALVIGLLMPDDDQDQMRRAEHSMQLIARAVEAYHAEYGDYPPAVVHDTHGRPMHSWRTLILPFLGERQLYQLYRFEEPWNSPHNLQLAELRPACYRCFSIQESPSTSSNQCSLALLLPPSQPDQLATSPPASNRPWIIEHEQLAGCWLKPDAPLETVVQQPANTREEIWSIDWDLFQRIPPAQRGFWDHGFFRSRFRGRLIASTSACLHLHPSANSAQVIAELEGDHAGGERHHIIGKPHVHWHWINACRLACFLITALCPLLWLRQDIQF